MSPLGVPPSGRRSPLDHVHAALGARWRVEDIRWPESYGDAAAEAVAIQHAVGLAEIGPADKLMVRGARTGEGLTAVGLQPLVRHVTRLGTLESWTLADDEALVVIPDTTAEGPSSAALATGIRGAGARVTDLSSGLALLALVGPAAGAVLQELCPVDVSERALVDDGIIVAPVANVRVLLTRQGSQGQPGFRLLVARDEAQYLWETLLKVGAPHGIRPVGGALAR